MKTDADQLKSRFDNCIFRHGLFVAFAIVLTFPLVAVLAQEKPEDRPDPHGDWAEDCTKCHQEPWVPIKPTKDFKHAKNFPLKGAHATASCTQCHTTLDFDKKPSASCVSCHQDIHRGEMGLDCAKCHEPTVFNDRPKLVRMHQTSRFPLRAAHVGAACESCHQPRGQGQLQYSGVGTSCADCHTQPGVPDAPKSPAWHTSAGFPRDCLMCHSDQRPGFRPANNFKHPVSGSFDLTSAHATLSCNDCHQSRGYQISFTGDCTQCHQADYQRAPSHVASNFPRDCTQCHSKSTFGGARFNHATSRFPEYAWTPHRTASCTSCHGSGVYVGTTTDCYTCHQTEFTSQTNPSHVGANFGRTKAECTTCHTSQTTFVGGRYAAHDTRDMQIYSGRHRGRWTDCSECHTSNSNYMTVSCASCHSRTSTDNIHRGRAGYAYNPPLCVSCHNLK